VSALAWWKTAVFYQIYPRSFADGNGDGIGDFQGMMAALPYLQRLGVDAIWLSPHFPSPMWDCGYDISDYEAVAPEYGDLKTFAAFLDSAHARGMHVILDLVLNHTSDQHAWFLESSSGRNNPKSDWYIWKDPVFSPPSKPDGAAVPAGAISGTKDPGAPPNNWQSCFDGPAWTYEPRRGQYYYHYFMKQQPDLNWSNPEVKAAMWKAVRFWLELGVDGFRLDAIGTIYEDPKMTPHSVPLDLAGLRSLSDSAQTPQEKELCEHYWHEMFKYQWGGPGLHDLMKELRLIMDEYPGERMLVGEDDNIDYLGNGNDELHLVFNFPLMRTEHITPVHVRQNQAARLSRLEALLFQGWGCNTLGNHDCSRLLTRYGNGVDNESIARLHLTMLLTLPGTPFLYNGEEIGMSDWIITDPAKLRDTMATWYYDRLVNDHNVDTAQAAQRAGKMSRDKNRTPFQWSNTVNAGFCPEGVTPWLPVNPDFSSGVNVADQESDPTSMLNYYRQLLRVRKSTPALISGEYQSVHEEDEFCLLFMRRLPDQTVLVVMNFSNQIQKIDLADLHIRQCKVIHSGEGSNKLSSKQAILDPYGFLLIECTPGHG
jgi:alpha-glucosidase